MISLSDNQLRIVMAAASSVRLRSAACISRGLPPTCRYGAVDSQITTLLWPRNRHWGWFTTSQRRRERSALK
jgi:hypothetical protein